jgi:hypothetical protein
MSELEALPAVEGWGGIKNSTGRITLPAWYKGVLLADLCALVSELGASVGIHVVAEDGYAMTMSYDQVNGGAFVAYDPATGEEINPGTELVAVIGYQVDGEPLPEKSDGKLRLMILGDRNTQVTDGHWWVKWVDTIEIREMGQEWYLSLEGMLSEEMDRGTFESCSSPSCHGVVWTDDEGHEWLGTALYLIAARVDDENKHDFGGFNVELAESGYEIQLVAADGYTVTIASGDASGNNDMIIAHQLDGEPLPEEFYPLRSVGPALEKKEMVGQIASINVILQPAGDVLPQASTGEAALTVNGLVQNELWLAYETLAELEVVEITAEHPRKGEQAYSGIRLNALLERAVIAEGADTLLITASDNYAALVPLDALGACADCLVAFDEGMLRTVMPGMESSAWVKEVVTLTLTGGGTEVAEQDGTLESLPQAGADEAALTITGLVENEQFLSMETLQSLEGVTVETEHPRKGTMETYEGIRMSTLLAYVVPAGEATSVLFTAIDSYAIELSLADVTGCPDCLVAFNDVGGLRTIMAGMDGQAWVKDLVSIEVR